MPHVLIVADIKRDDTRKNTLRNIADTLQNYPDPLELNDATVTAIINETAQDYLAASKDPEILRLTIDIRNSTYEVDEKEYPSTKRKLRQTAKRLICSPNGDVTPVQIWAFNEITKHADKWPFHELASVKRKLRHVRRSREFLNYLSEGGSLWQDNRFVAKRDWNIEEYNKRIWKRVWPTKGPDGTGDWGWLKCLPDNGNPCPGTDLEEVSICGATCLNCDRSKNSSPRKIEFLLPKYPSEPVVVRRAIFREHNVGTYFGRDGSRLERGMSLEFLEIDEKYYERLTSFVRERNELDPKRRPFDAPIKRDL